MKRLTIYILLFCATICLPLSFLIWRTYTGVAQEERAQLRFFGETLFDEMQAELSGLVRREEGRAADEYNHAIITRDNRSMPSPLATAPQEDFILGYFQNNPDGAMQTPLVPDTAHVAGPNKALVDQLEIVNRAFNQKKYSLPAQAEPPKPMPIVAEQVQKEEKGFAERYLAPTKQKAAKSFLGQQSARVEEISPRQAANLAKDETAEARSRMDSDRAFKTDYEEDKKIGGGTAATDALGREQLPAASVAGPAHHPPPLEERRRFQVEVTPLQSVFIDDGLIFIFRRVAINNQVFRQGFALKVQPFLHHLAQTHFDPQPIAGFTRLSLKVMDHGGPGAIEWSGAIIQTASIVAGRTFPAPFNFIRAELMGDGVPSTATRRALNAALIALGTIMLLGLLAIYQSVRAVVALSERRSQFVSAVTHELKTPLTNIRMYVEMLEHGIAATPEREQAYLGVIGSESSRLSRLINNVLELSKLEKKQRLVRMEPGSLQDVLAEVRAVMAPKLAQEGFELQVQADPKTQFSYDREAMIQVLINLIENSIKFGRHAAERRISVSVDSRAGWARIAVADTGPGIPHHALAKVFDDFYRADNTLTRETSGTGIGLALVKKLTHAMGGRVEAANNAGPGCTITVMLPRRSPGPEGAGR